MTTATEFLEATADRLRSLVPPILRLRQRKAVDVFLIGETVCFGGTFATVTYDDGETARIEAIEGEHFRLETTLWPEDPSIVYARWIEVDSWDLARSNQNRKRHRRVIAPMPDSLRASRRAPFDQSAEHIPPGALR